MDFFEAQDRAKRNTGKLVGLYILAVIGIIFSVYLVSIALFYSQVSGTDGRAISDMLWNPAALFFISVIVLSVITIGTLFRVAQLRKGGSAVAEMLGGRRIEPSTKQQNERRLMNIVEEMSIASGIPVPDVYILDKEENINAFAAGLTTQDAAVGVTRGALEQLTRDEMQGVIAHEFSHIFNGDMRLNIRLIGILNGILLIHMMGLIIIRSMAYSGGRRSRSRDGDGGGKSTIVIILFGVALIIIGYIGMLFGRMIQSAISRQREYLADAAAVQYTRNPDGLAGALSKIGSKEKGAEINDGHAMEMSHLFFASSFHSLFDKLYATHPPIKDRIKAINPSLDVSDLQKKTKLKDKFQKEHISGSTKPADSRGIGGLGGHPALTPEVILGAIGTLDSNHMNRAETLIQNIPESLKQAAHESLGAEALIYAMLLKSTEAEKLPEWFNESIDSALIQQVDKIFADLSADNREWFLPLTEMAMPALRHISSDQYKNFRVNVKKLISDSNEENLFAFLLEKMVVRQLDTAFSKTKSPLIRHHHFKTLVKEMTIMLSALSHASDENPESAWQAGLKPIEKLIPDSAQLLPKEECRLNKLDGALDELAASANPVKKYVLSSIIHCITSDKVVSTKEKELTRAISEAMDCPIPLGAMG